MRQAYGNANIMCGVITAYSAVISPAFVCSLQCIVFNCSDQIDHTMPARLFSGLVQTGAWTCLDEFNRINIEVLSVIAEQVGHEPVVWCKLIADIGFPLGSRCWAHAFSFCEVFEGRQTHFLV